ncbi:hypothetical protein BOO71_0000544 [Deinococcus marmoris]|uniref:Uncharacterized protein n=1 Tax=Deinococcus marmoris TaxID=249408 RepID=A0A1U7P4S7_9DEIO|nr:hypothetical protein BOO71_0000544 [Deinococcus marmoris]
MFQHILDSREIFLEDFAKKSNIALSTLGMYITGELDIARMRQATAERFIGTLGITDKEAWKLFHIPLPQQRSFRTFRPKPWGHGEDSRNLIELELKSPLHGEWTVPAGHIVQIDPDSTLEGIVITELDDGRLFALPAQLAAGRGRVMGQLVGALAAFKEK